MRIGFIGLGQMGRGMAHRLMDHGHELIVWNRSAASAESLQTRGAQIAAECAQTLSTDIVISMLSDDAAIRSVWMESGLARHCRAGSLHLNMATTGLTVAQELAEAHAACGCDYVSAPVFGRPEYAREGQLDIVAAGPARALERCSALFEILGRRWFNVGADPRHANVVKIARNFMLSAIIESLGESFALVEKAGVLPSEFLDIITRTSMNAPAFKNYGRLMLERPANPTFPLRLGLKDVELALEAAAEVGITLPSAALIRDQHLAAIAHGYGDKDWAELGTWIAEQASIPKPKPD